MRINQYAHIAKKCEKTLPLSDSPVTERNGRLRKAVQNWKKDGLHGSILRCDPQVFMRAGSAVSRSGLHSAPVRSSTALTGHGLDSTQSSSPSTLTSQTSAHKAAHILC